MNSPPPPLRLVQTGDWHLGQPYRNVSPEVADRLRSARLEAVERVLTEAARLGAALMLATGDQFDGPHVAPDLVRDLLDLLGSHPKLPIHMIPGNHDPGAPGSVYARAGFRLPSNLHLHLEARPVPLPDLGATLYPCPCTARFGPDPMSWIPSRTPGDGLRIGLAHGSLPQFGDAERRNYPIAADAPERYDLDYVALGDWHTANPWPEDRPAERMYYAGAPEIGGWDETNAGTALVVELAPDRPPRVRRLRIGQFAWHDRAPTLHGPADIHDLFGWLDGLAPSTSLVRLTPRGSLTAEDRALLEDGLAARSEGFALLRAELDDLQLLGDADLDLPRDPLVRAVHERLLRLAADPTDAPPATYPPQAQRLDPAIVARALGHFRDLLPRRSEEV